VEYLGIHLLVEMIECNQDKINNILHIKDSLLMAAEVAGATIINSFFHEFSPNGISGVVILAESHISIHSWPEEKYAAVDVFMCGSRVDPWKASEYLEIAFDAKKVKITDILRGSEH
jgi:S-adenosylmethionine decarboxylase proenzyme